MSFGMITNSLGLLAIMAGQFGNTRSPLAGSIIIIVWPVWLPRTSRCCGLRLVPMTVEY